MDASIATEPTSTQTSGNGDGSEQNVGRIEEIQGVVIEAVFPDRLPEINHAITVARPAAAKEEEAEGISPGAGESVLVCEVQQHLGDDRVREVAMDTTDGLARGVEVLEVMDGSPAERAILRPEDLIVSADGVPVADVADLQRLLVGDRIGQRLTLRVVRAGELREVELVPRELDG